MSPSGGRVQRRRDLAKTSINFLRLRQTILKEKLRQAKTLPNWTSMHENYLSLDHGHTRERRKLSMHPRLCHSTLFRHVYP